MFPDPIPALLDRDDVSISSSVPSTDSLVDCCLVDDFNLNALHFESVTPHYSDAIELDDDSVSPDDFICHECTLCSTSASIRSPVDQFLFDAAWNPPILDSDCTLHEILADHPVPAPHLHRDFDGPRAHFDDGAQVSTTHIQSHLFAYQAFTDSKPCRVRLKSADGHRYTPTGYGILRVPAPNVDGYVPVLTFFTPEIPTCIISPQSVERLIPKRHLDSTSLHKFSSAASFTFVLHHKQRRSQNISIHGILAGGLCYTEPLILPESMLHHLPPDDFSADLAENELLLDALRAVYDYDGKTVNFEFDIFRLSARAERLLWHQRLSHAGDDVLYNAHKHITGVPKFAHRDPVLEQCPTCLAAKLRKQAAGHNTTRRATVPFQGLSIDFAFTGQESKNKTRGVDYKGINGETCYLLISDHATTALEGSPRISKGAPISWLHQWLRRRSPNVQDKYVYLDQGGELYRNPRIRKLFRSFGYEVFPTGADASHQNAPVERANQSIGEGIRSLLTGSNLPAKFWPYAFHFYLRTKNANPTRGRDLSAYEQLHSGKQEDFSRFRTFGCRVWVRPPGKRKGKLINNARKGIFLGYLPHTTKNLLWYDLETHRVKIAFHARFDEGMNDLPADSIPPNVQHLQRVRDGLPLEPDDHDLSVSAFVFRDSPFSSDTDDTVRVICTHPTFGFQLAEDTETGRVYAQDLIDHSSALTLRSSPNATRRKYRGAFITAIAETPIFSMEDANAAFLALRNSPDLRKFVITLAPEPLRSRRDQAHSLDELDLLHTTDDDGAILRSLKFEDNYDTIFDGTADDEEPTIGIHELLAIHRLRTDEPSDLDTPLESIECMIQALQSEALTPEEQALGSFTRRKLKNLSTWPLWKEAEIKQLDQFHDLGMYGQPCKRPPGAIVLPPHWQYRVKTNGTRRSRNCCDGSPRAAPALHRLAQTYASCIEQPCFRLFTALSTALLYTIYAGDACDAFAHSPAPRVPTYLRINDAFAEWYEQRFHKPVDRNHVLPIQHALQGHPESARLWDEHITGILMAIGFKNTKHERNLYVAHIDGTMILLARQVDDFALASPSPALAAKVFDQIGAALQLPGEDKPPFKNLGVVDSFNGVDVLQTRDYNKISCESYLNRLLKGHSWETPAQDEPKPGSRPTEPLSPSVIKELYTTPGSPEHTKEHGILETQMGYSYRSLLGEIMYAYVVARPDIGYAVTTLAKFSKAPARVHYQCLKRLALYLRQTIDWGIIYWRPSPLSDLPVIPFLGPTYDSTLPSFPAPDGFFELTGYVDAAHGNDLTRRRSTTGYGFMLAGGVIAYRCKTQTITATSSTEAEFIAAVSAAKVAKYLRSILRELGFSQKGPTVLYEDNESCIKMINASVPTERSRHIDISYFAIQDWKSAGDILLRHIPGILNASDTMTKAVGWILHNRHARRLMGHYGFARSLL
jgi:hypothetical protein